MLNQLKTLLSDTQLRQQIKLANSLADAISLLTSVVDQGEYQFSSNILSKMMESDLEVLDERDLITVAGGLGHQLPKPTRLETCL